MGSGKLLVTEWEIFEVESSLWVVLNGSDVVLVSGVLSLTLDGDMVRLPQISYLRGYCVIGEGLGLPVKDLVELQQNTWHSIVKAKGLLFDTISSQVGGQIESAGLVPVLLWAAPGH